MKTGRGQRVLAWVLALAMIFTNMIMLPSEKVSAEDIFLNYKYEDNNNIAKISATNAHLSEDGTRLYFDYFRQTNSAFGAGMEIKFIFDAAVMDQVETMYSQYFYTTWNGTPYLSNDPPGWAKPIVNDGYGLEAVKKANTGEYVFQYINADNSIHKEMGNNWGIFTSSQESQRTYMYVQFKQDMRQILGAGAHYLKTYITYEDKTLMSRSICQVPIDTRSLDLAQNGSELSPLPQMDPDKTWLCAFRIDPEAQSSTTMRSSYDARYNAIILDLTYWPNGTTVFDSHIAKDFFRGVLMMPPDLVENLDHVELWRMGSGNDYLPKLEVKSGTSNAVYSTNPTARSLSSDKTYVGVVESDGEGIRKPIALEGNAQVNVQNVNGSKKGVLIFAPYAGKNLDSIYNTWSNKTQRAKIVIYLNENMTKIYPQAEGNHEKTLEFEHMFTSVQNLPDSANTNVNEMKYIRYSYSCADFSIIDTDGDGLTDIFEQYIGSNVYVKDTDGDGRTDGEEIHSPREEKLEDNQTKFIGSDPLTPVPEWPKQKIEAGTTTISGKTTPYRTVSIYRNDKAIGEAVSDEQGNYTIIIGKVLHRIDVDGETTIDGANPADMNSKRVDIPGGVTLNKGDVIHLKVWTDGLDSRRLKFSIPEEPVPRVVGESSPVNIFNPYDTETTIWGFLPDGYEEGAKGALTVKIGNETIPEQYIQINQDTSKFPVPKTFSVNLEAMPPELRAKLPLDSSRGGLKIGTHVILVASQYGQEEKTTDTEIAAGPAFDNLEAGATQISVTPPADFTANDVIKIRIYQNDVPSEPYDTVIENGHYVVKGLSADTLKLGTKVEILPFKNSYALHPVADTVGPPWYEVATDTSQAPEGYVLVSFTIKEEDQFKAYMEKTLGQQPSGNVSKKVFAVNKGKAVQLQTLAEQLKLHYNNGYSAVTPEWKDGEQQDLASHLQDVITVARDFTLQTPNQDLARIVENPSTEPAEGYVRLTYSAGDDPQKGVFKQGEITTFDVAKGALWSEVQKELKKEVEAKSKTFPPKIDVKAPYFQTGWTGEPSGTPAKIGESPITITAQYNKAWYEIPTTTTTVEGYVIVRFVIPQAEQQKASMTKTLEPASGEVFEKAFAVKADQKILLSTLGEQLKLVVKSGYTKPTPLWKNAEGQSYEENKSKKVTAAAMYTLQPLTQNFVQIVGPDDKGDATHVIVKYEAGSHAKFADHQKTYFRVVKDAPWAQVKAEMKQKVEALPQTTPPAAFEPTLVIDKGYNFIRWKGEPTGTDAKVTTDLTITAVCEKPAVEVDPNNPGDKPGESYVKVTFTIESGNRDKAYMDKTLSSSTAAGQDNKVYVKAFWVDKNAHVKYSAINPQVHAVTGYKLQSPAWDNNFPTEPANAEVTEDKNYVLLEPEEQKAIEKNPGDPVTEGYVRVEYLKGAHGEFASGSKVAFDVLKNIQWSEAKKAIQDLATKGKYAFPPTVVPSTTYNHTGWLNEPQATATMGEKVEITADYRTYIYEINPDGTETPPVDSATDKAYDYVVVTFEITGDNQQKAYMTGTYGDSPTEKAHTKKFALDTKHVTKLSELTADKIGLTMEPGYDMPNPAWDNGYPTDLEKTPQTKTYTFVNPTQNFVEIADPGAQGDESHIIITYTTDGNGSYAQNQFTTFKVLKDKPWSLVKDEMASDVAAKKATQTGEPKAEFPPKTVANSGYIFIKWTGEPEGENATVGKENFEIKANFAKTFYEVPATGEVKLPSTDYVFVTFTIEEAYKGQATMDKTEGENPSGTVQTKRYAVNKKAGVKLSELQPGPKALIGYQLNTPVWQAPYETNKDQTISQENEYKLNAPLQNFVEIVDSPNLSDQEKETYAIVQYAPGDHGTIAAKQKRYFKVLKGKTWSVLEAEMKTDVEAARGTDTSITFPPTAEGTVVANKPFNSYVFDKWTDMQGKDDVIDADKTITAAYLAYIYEVEAGTESFANTAYVPVHFVIPESLKQQAYMVDSYQPKNPPAPVLKKTFAVNTQKAVLLEQITQDQLKLHGKPGYVLQNPAWEDPYQANEGKAIAVSAIYTLKAPTEDFVQIVDENEKGDETHIVISYKPGDHGAFADNQKLYFKVVKNAPWAKVKAEMEKEVNAVTPVTDPKATFPPMVIPAATYSFIKWEGEPTTETVGDKNFDITATYDLTIKEVDPANPGNKPSDDYVLVKFVIGTDNHDKAYMEKTLGGAASGEVTEKAYYVDKRAEVVLNTLDPKVKAKTGYVLADPAWANNYSEDSSKAIEADKTYNLANPTQDFVQIVGEDATGDKDHVIVKFVAKAPGSFEAKQKIYFKVVKGKEWSVLAEEMKQDVQKAATEAQDETITFPPTVTMTGAFNHVGWDGMPTGIVDKDTEITALYKAYVYEVDPDAPGTLPSDPSTPQKFNYVWVTFTIPSGDADKAYMDGTSGVVTKTEVLKKQFAVDTKHATQLKTLDPKLHAKDTWTLPTDPWGAEYKTNYEKDIVSEQHYTLQTPTKKNVIIPNQDNPGTIPDGYVRVTFNDGGDAAKGKFAEGQTKIFDVLKTATWAAIRTEANAKLSDPAEFEPTIVPTTVQDNPAKSYNFIGWDKQPGDQETLEHNSHVVNNALTLTAQYKAYWEEEPDPNIDSKTLPANYVLVTFTINDEDKAYMGSDADHPKYKRAFSVDKTKDILLSTLDPQLHAKATFDLPAEPWGSNYEKKKTQAVKDNQAYVLAAPGKKPGLIVNPDDKVTDGYIRVVFEQGDHGQFAGNQKTTFDVLKGKQWSEVKTYLTAELSKLGGTPTATFPPTIIPDTSGATPDKKYNHIGWENMPADGTTLAEPTGTDKTITITAQYKAYWQEEDPSIDPTKLPAGYVAVTFQISDGDQTKAYMGAADATAADKKHKRVFSVDKSRELPLKTFQPDLHYEPGYEKATPEWDNDYATKLDKAVTETVTYTLQTPVENFVKPVDPSAPVENGFTRVVFEQGDHGTFAAHQKTAFDVLSTAQWSKVETEIRAELGKSTEDPKPTFPPTVNPTEVANHPEQSYSHIGWQNLPTANDTLANFNKVDKGKLTITALYKPWFEEEKPDIKKADLPQNYVLVTFQIGSDDHSKAYMGDANDKKYKRVFSVYTGKDVKLSVLNPQLVAEPKWQLPEEPWGSLYKQNYEKPVKADQTYTLVAPTKNNVIIPDGPSTPDGYVRITFSDGADAAKGKFYDGQKVLYDVLKGAKWSDIKAEAATEVAAITPAADPAREFPPKVKATETADPFTSYIHSGWKDMPKDADVINDPKTITAEYLAWVYELDPANTAELHEGYHRLTFQITGVNEQRAYMDNSIATTLPAKPVLKKVFAVNTAKSVTLDKIAPAKVEVHMNPGYVMPDPLWDNDYKTNLTKPIANDKDTIYTMETAAQNFVQITDQNDNGDDNFAIVEYAAGTNGKFADNQPTYFRVLKTADWSVIKAEMKADVDKYAAEHSNLNPAPTFPPTIVPKDGYNHTGWSGEPESQTAKITEKTIITAVYKTYVYEVDPDNPGTLPTNYVLVKFTIEQNEQDKAYMGADTDKKHKRAFAVDKTKEIKLSTIDPELKAKPTWQLAEKPWGDDYETAKTENVTDNQSYTLVAPTKKNVIVVDDPDSKIPEGYVRVTFAKGEHGKFAADQKTVFDVLKKAEWSKVKEDVAKALKSSATFPPTIVPDVVTGDPTKSYNHIGWENMPADSDTLETFNKVSNNKLTITAQYKAYWQEEDPNIDPTKLPEGYVAVIFEIPTAEQGKAYMGAAGAAAADKKHKRVFSVDKSRELPLKTFQPDLHYEPGYEKADPEWNNDYATKLATPVTATVTYTLQTPVQNFVRIVDPQNPGDVPEGFIRVAFNKGSHGEFAANQETMFDVLATAKWSVIETEIKGELAASTKDPKPTFPPTVTPTVVADHPEQSYSFTGWDQLPGADDTLDKNKNVDKATKTLTITAQYRLWFEEVDPENPGTLPKDFVTVTFIINQSEQDMAYMGAADAPAADKKYKRVFSVDKTKGVLLKLLNPELQAEPTWQLPEKPWGDDYATNYEQAIEGAQSYTLVAPTKKNVIVVDDPSSKIPDGYVRVTFAKGDHGKFADGQKTVFDVLKTAPWSKVKEDVAKALTSPATFPPNIVPDVTANDPSKSYNHIGWENMPADKDTLENFSKVSENKLTITALYKAYIFSPGKGEELPKDYVKVEFKIKDADQAKGNFGEDKDKNKIYSISYAVDKTKKVTLDQIQEPVSKLNTGYGYADPKWNNDYAKKVNEKLEITEALSFELQFETFKDSYAGWSDDENGPPEHQKDGYKKVVFVVDPTAFNTPDGKKYYVVYVKPDTKTPAEIAPKLEWKTGYGQPKTGSGSGEDQGWDNNFGKNKQTKITEGTKYTALFDTYGQVESEPKPGYTKVGFVIEAVDQVKANLGENGGKTLYEFVRWVNPNGKTSFAELLKQVPALQVEPSWKFVEWAGFAAVEKQSVDKDTANPTIFKAVFKVRSMILNPSKEDEDKIVAAGTHYKVVFKAGDGYFDPTKVKDLVDQVGKLSVGGSNGTSSSAVTQPGTVSTLSLPSTIRTLGVRPADAVDVLTFFIDKANDPWSIFNLGQANSYVPDPTPNQDDQKFIRFANDTDGISPVPDKGDIEKDYSFTAVYRGKIYVDPTPENPDDDVVGKKAIRVVFKVKDYGLGGGWFEYQNAKGETVKGTEYVVYVDPDQGETLYKEIVPQLHLDRFWEFLRWEPPFNNDDKVSESAEHTAIIDVIKTPQPAPKPDGPPLYYGPRNPNHRHLSEPVVPVQPKPAGDDQGQKQNLPKTGQAQTPVLPLTLSAFALCALALFLKRKR